MGRSVISNGVVIHESGGEPRELKAASAQVEQTRTTYLSTLLELLELLQRFYGEEFTHSLRSQALLHHARELRPPPTDIHSKFRNRETFNSKGSAPTVLDHSYE